jgi:plastocyanin
MSIARAIPSTRHLPAAIWTAIAMLALVACSPSASASAPGASAAPAQSAAAAPSEGGTVGGDTTVTITGLSFGDDFTIAAGSSVTFVNNDSVAHTVTNGVDGVAEANALFDISLAPGASTDPIVFDTPGVYPVTCKIHPTINLTITVE